MEQVLLSSSDPSAAAVCLMSVVRALMSPLLAPGMAKLERPLEEAAGALPCLLGLAEASFLCPRREALSPGVSNASTGVRGGRLPISGSSSALRSAVGSARAILGALGPLELLARSASAPGLGAAPAAPLSCSQGWARGGPPK
eukprot:16451041-Heterocapsa_arctica.AAC.1